MSGDGEFTSLRKVVEKSVGETESLINQLHSLQMPKSPTEPEELRGIVAAFNNSRDALSSEFKSLKDLIEQYREANFVRLLGGFHVGASTPSDLRLEWAKFEPGEDPLDSAIQWTCEQIVNLFAYGLGTNHVLRAQITHDRLPEIFNRRRNQDIVSENLKAALKVLGIVFDWNPKLFVDLVLEVLLKFANFVKEFALDVAMTLADWISAAIDLVALALLFLQGKAEDVASFVSHLALTLEDWISVVKDVAFRALDVTQGRAKDLAKAIEDFIAEVTEGLVPEILNVDILRGLAKEIMNEMAQFVGSWDTSTAELLRANPGLAVGLAGLLIFAVWDHIQIKGARLFNIDLHEVFDPSKVW